MHFLSEFQEESNIIGVYFYEQSHNVVWDKTLYYYKTKVHSVVMSQSVSNELKYFTLILGSESDAIRC